MGERERAEELLNMPAGKYSRNTTRNELQRLYNKGYISRDELTQWEQGAGIVKQAPSEPRSKEAEILGKDIDKQREEAQKQQELISQQTELTEKERELELIKIQAKARLRSTEVSEKEFIESELDKRPELKTKKQLSNELVQQMVLRNALPSATAAIPKNAKIKIVPVKQKEPEQEKGTYTAAQKPKDVIEVLDVAADRLNQQMLKSKSPVAKQLAGYSELGAGVVSGVVYPFVRPIEIVQGYVGLATNPVGTFKAIGTQFYERPAYTIGQFVGGGLLFKAAGKAASNVKARFQTSELLGEVYVNPKTGELTSVGKGTVRGKPSEFVLYKKGELSKSFLRQPGKSLKLFEFTDEPIAEIFKQKDTLSITETTPENTLTNVFKGNELLSEKVSKPSGSVFEVTDLKQTAGRVYKEVFKGEGFEKTRGVTTEIFGQKITAVSKNKNIGSTLNLKLSDIIKTQIEMTPEVITIEKTGLGQTGFELNRPIFEFSNEPLPENKVIIESVPEGLQITKIKAPQLLQKGLKITTGYGTIKIVEEPLIKSDLRFLNQQAQNLLKSKKGTVLSQQKQPMLTKAPEQFRMPGLFELPKFETPEITSNYFPFILKPSPKTNINVSDNVQPKNSIKVQIIPDISILPKTSVKTYQKSELFIDTSSLIKENNIVSNILKQQVSPVQDNIFKVETKAVQQTKQMQTQSQLQKQAQVQSSFVNSVTSPVSFDYDFSLPTPQFHIDIPVPKQEPLKKLVQGFDVFVKRRGKFEKQSVRPLTKSVALSFGAKSVQKSAAATFKVLPANSYVYDIEKEDDYFKKIANQFNTKKGSYIELPKFRINTPGELSQITKKGVEASKKKKKIFPFIKI